MQKTKSIQIYLKPEIEEDSLLLDAWQLCRQRSRPQVVFRRMLQEGLRVLVESGEMPSSIREELESHPAFRDSHRTPLPYRTGTDRQGIRLLDDIIRDLARKGHVPSDGGANPSSPSHQPPDAGRHRDDDETRAEAAGTGAGPGQQPFHDTDESGFGSPARDEGDGNAEVAAAVNVDRSGDIDGEAAPNVDSFPDLTSSDGAVRNGDGQDEEELPDAVAAGASGVEVGSTDSGDRRSIEVGDQDDEGSGATPNGPVPTSDTKGKGGPGKKARRLKRIM